MPDRIYSVQYNGRIYDVRAAETASPSEIFAYVQQQAGGGPKGAGEEENLLEKIPVVGGVLAGAADIPLNVASGLAGTAKTFTDLFGADNAASDFLEEVSQYAESLTSAQSREDAKTAAAIQREAEGKGIWEEVKAAARAFTVNPIDTLAEVAGGAIPFVAAAASGAGIPAAAGLGVASGVGTVKGSISDAVYARAREAGVPEKEAELMAEQAQAYGGDNLDMIALGGVLGGVASATGFDKALGRAIAKRAVTDVVEEGVEQQVRRGVVRRGTTGFGAEALPEATQAGQERFAQNLAEQRAGYETDLMAGVAGQAAFEGLAGGVLGGTLGVVDRGGARPITSDEEILSEREELEADIAATGIPEAEDPEIRTRAAEYMQLLSGINPARAIELAVYEREQQQAARRQEEAPSAVSEPDIGGSEPDISGVSEPDAVAEPAGPPADAGRRPVGGTSVPTGQPMAGEGVVEPPLAPQPIIPPIEQVSPEAQIAEQLAPKVAPAVEEAAPVKSTLPDLNAQIDEYTSFVSKGAQAPAPLVESIARQYVDAMKTTGVEGVISPDRMPAFSQFIGNEIDTLTPLFEAQAAPEQGVSETAGTLEQDIAAPTETAPAMELPPEVQEAQAFVDQYNPGFEIRYKEADKRRRYSYGLPGGKAIFSSPNLDSVKNKILNEKPIQPKQVIEGVPVKQMPAGKAQGLEEAKPVEAEPEPKGPAGAGKLTPAQEQQQGLLEEIDRNRRAKLINDAQRTELLDMLRTPTAEELDIYRRGLSDKEVAKRRALRSVWNPVIRVQNEIDALTKEGRLLRIEEAAAEKLTDEEAQTAKKAELKDRVDELIERVNSKRAEQVEAKEGIYKAVRDKLAQAKRKPTIQKAGLKKQLAEGKINKQQYDRMVRDLTPEPYMFRKAKGKATGITLEELNAAVEKITSRWGARLEPKTVQSATDLPAAIRKEIEDLGRTDAFGFYKDGKAYLIADNMNGVDDVTPTLYHEALGHLGLRARFRDGLDKVLTDIYRTNKNVAGLADKWLNANQDLYKQDENPTARAVEEVLASASEKGPLRASRFDKLVKFIKDFARQYLGLDLKFNDREVRTILAMAHEQALSGEGTVMGSSSMMFSTPEQQEASQETADAAIAAQKSIEKVATTTTDRQDMEAYSRGFFGGINGSLKSKTSKNWFKGFSLKNFDRGWVERKGLEVMPTDGALDLMETMLGDTPVTRELRNAIDIADRMNGSRATTRRTLNKMVGDLKEYLLSNADPIVVDGKKLKALPVAMDHGNYYNINMVKLMEVTSREDAFKSDQIWRRYNKLLQNPSLDAKTKKDYEAKRKQREADIDGAMHILSKLGKEGRRLYTRIRNMNRDMQTARQFFMDKRIEALRDAGVADDVISQLMVSIRAEQERLNDRVNAPAKEDAHKDYPEVPLGLFHREYFPKRRYGDYWLRIKRTKFGEPILKFYETADERDADLEAAAEEFGLDINNNKDVDYGNDAQKDLGADFDAGDALVKTLKMISDLSPDTFTEGKKTRLRADIYQLYLQSTPEGSGRKQFIKSKNRLGWSSDILRTVGVTAEEYATDAARLQFAPDIDRAISAATSAMESLEPSPRSLARQFINNIQDRISAEMEPAPDGFVNKIVPWANQVAYIAFLTAPATALVQVTALPIRVAPNLWGKYGMPATTRAMGRYMNVFGNIPKFEGKDKAARKTFRIPTLMESNVVKNSKRHRDALTRATDEYGLIIPLSEFTMGQERTPQTATQGRVSEVRQKAYDAMTYLFDASEQLTREVAFMTAYDLEYDKLASAGLSPEERQTKAVIAAKDTVNYTLGNYTNLNRPPIMKGSELARALFLFKQYSVITTRFFVQGTRAIFGKDTPRDERVAAMKEMTGVLGMSFMMGGVVALPLYTLGMMTLQALQDMTDDDEDRRERMRQNPITADSVELQFRYEWLPEHFGQPMVTDASGKKITLGDIILNGAVSEATGWNFGSRVSLDLVGMWFRAPKDADTWTQTINNALVENIPGASASLNIVTMGEEIAKGNVLKGLEVGLPAMLKAPLKAYRLETEGVRTQTEKIKLANEEISNTAIIGAVLGFNPTQVAKMQQENRDILNRRKELQEEKSDLLGAYKRAVRRIQNGDADGQEEARKAFKDIMDYNKKVGNPYFGISYANIYKSLTGAASEAKYDIQGMGLNEVESYYAEKTLGRD
jgi:hypothetical protein